MADEILNWEYKDTLRQMVDKFNVAVSAILDLQVNTKNVNDATIQAMEEIQNNFNDELETIKQDLKSKIDSVTAEDLNLGNVDNTSDMDKPVSTATQEAINSATKNMATTEEVSGELKTIELYDPEISTPVKTYIENRIAELFNAYQNNTYNPDYRIATADRLGVIKSGGAAEVDPNSGLIEIPRLDALRDEVNRVKTNITTLTEALESNNTSTSELIRNQGELNDLTTINKTSLVTAINELVAMVNELVDTD